MDEFNLMVSEQSRMWGSRSKRTKNNAPLVNGVCVATERKPGKLLLPIPLIRSTESFCSYPISLAAHSLVMGVGKELCKIRPSRQVGRPSEHDKHLSCWASKPVYRHFALSSTG